MVFQVTGDKFAGYTLSELRAMVLRKLRVTDTSRYSPTKGTSDYDWIDDVLNRAQINFAKRTKCIKGYAVIELKANYRAYRAPADFLDLDKAYFYDSSLTDGYEELLIKTTDWLSDEKIDWRTDTGTPDYIYADRIYGNQWVLGFAPIPESDGDTFEFDSEYGVLIDWVCPGYTFNREYGVFIRSDSSDQFFLNTDVGVIGKMEAMNKNVLIEYYRLPLVLEYTEQYPDIPNEYQVSLVDDATSDLLQNNPEDSVEFKRSLLLEKKVDKEVDEYINKRKKFIGHELQARSAVWAWQRNMPYYKDIP
jgi:hypothetical protein